MSSSARSVNSKAARIERLIVRDEYADRHFGSASSGIEAATSYPPPRLGPARSCPWKSPTRSRIPRCPYLARRRSGSSLRLRRPSSTISGPGWTPCSGSPPWLAPARHVQHVGERLLHDPERRESRPAGGVAARLPPRARPGGPHRGTATGARSISFSPCCGIPHVGPIVVRPKKPQQPSASPPALLGPTPRSNVSTARPSSGSASKTRWAATDCATMTLTLCATTSWSSRAMTRRSSATACLRRLLPLAFESRRPVLEADDLAALDPQAIADEPDGADDQAFGEDGVDLDRLPRDDQDQ